MTKTYTPRQAAWRLYDICDELEQRHLAPEVLAEIRDLCQLFINHMEELPVFCERLEKLARSLQP